MSIPQSSHYLPSGVTEVPCEIPGKRSYNVRGVSFTIDKRYKIFKPIGVGAYGVVISAMDTSLGQMVALKKIGGLFDDLTDAKRVLREIRLMQAMSHDNVRAQFSFSSANWKAPETSLSFTSTHVFVPLFVSFRAVDPAVDRRGRSRINGQFQRDIHGYPTIRQRFE